MSDIIEKALNIADLNYQPLTWDERHTTVERAWTEVTALTDLLAAVRETRNMGSFAVPAHIKAALELYEEQTKGA